MKLLKQLALGPLIFFKLRWTKYKIYSIITFLLSPLLVLIDFYFRGSFVGTVRYLDTYVSYFLFILVGYVFARLAFSIFENSYSIFQQRKPVIVFKSVHPLVVPVSMSFITLGNVIIALIPISLVLILLGINPIFLFESLLLAYVFGFPAIFAIGVFFAALALVVRGRDFRALVFLMNKNLWILFPIMFGINALPLFLQPVALEIPTIALVEGTRRMILGLGGLNLLIYSLLSGLILLAISLWVFAVAFNWARKTGKILLR